VLSVHDGSDRSPTPKSGASPARVVRNGRMTDKRANPRKGTRGREVSGAGKRRALGAALAFALVGSAQGGCVRKATHDKTLAELDQVRADREAALAEAAKTKAELARLEEAMRARDATTQEADGERAVLTSKLDEASQQNQELGGRLDAAGMSLERLKGKNVELGSELASMQSRLTELRAQQAAIIAREEKQRALLEDFKAMIAAGDLAVEIEGGRVLLVLPNDVLFDNGKAEVKGAGKRVLRDVGAKLASKKNLELQVGGHTDDAPIHTERFPSNWELSTARAVEVVRLLEAEGLSPKRLSAAGYGEHRPAASNDEPEGRAKNRRIEIALVPDLEEVLADDAKTTAATCPPQGEAQSEQPTEGCSG
jgi:chemotaxis protein MotB